MNELLQDIDNLSNSTKILQPDQALQTYLIKFRTYLSTATEQLDLKSIEQTLLRLLKINNGDLDISCSLEIGHCLYYIYEKDPNKHFWLLSNDVTKNPTQANICAIKFVISKLGSYNKSGLNHIVQILLAHKKSKLQYPALITLRTLYKVYPNSFDKQVNSAFNFAKASANNHNSEKIQIASLRLLQVLVLEPEVQTKKVLSIAQQVLSEPKSKFVELVCADLVAQCAAQPFLKQMDEKPKIEEPNQISNFSIMPLPKNHILKESFEILLMFKSHFSTIFRFFLDRIPPDYVYLNIELLFNFVIQNSMADVTQLLSFFGRDIRSFFFSAVKSQKVINFYLLRLLIYDDSSAKEAAGVAHDRILSTSPEERKEVKKFFASLSHSYPQAALESLHVAVHYIAMPPDESPEMMNEYLGQAIIAAVLMALIGQKWEIEMPLVKRFVNLVINEHSDNDIYLESLIIVLTTQSPEFLAGYNIQELLNKISAKYISKLPTDFNSYPIRLIEYLLNFYSIHSYFDNIKTFFDFCLQITDRLSIIALISLIRLLQKLEISESESLSIATSLLNKCAQLHLYMNFIKIRVPRIMKIQQELFIVAKKEMEKNREIEAILFFADETQLASAIVDVIPYLFKKMNQTMAISFINTALNLNNKLAGYMAILSILQEATNDQSIISKIPENIHILLTKASLSISDDVILQVMSECIATYISLMPSLLPSYFSYLSKDAIPICFIETSLARLVNMNDDQVLQIVLRASNRLKNMSLAVYVLHELSTIYEAKSVQLMNLMIGEQQCQQLLTFITGNDIPVFTIYYVSQCFEKLIPILLPTLSEKPTMDMILVALNEFRNSSIPFYKQFFYDLFRAFFAFSKEISDYFYIEIPQNKMFVHNQLSACGALADIQRFKPFSANLLSVLPPFFVLLQRTKSKLVVNFLLSAAESACQKNPINEDELQDWFKLTNQILSKNSMVGFNEIEVEPNTTVKQTALTILKMFLKPLATLEPFHPECLDDLMTSTLRAIETKISELYETSYSILNDCLVYFADFRTKQNVYLLTLYEYQFSNAIRAAFPFYLDVAYTFIISYIDIQFKIYENPEKQKINCKLLIGSIIEYLQKIKKVHPTTGYNAIITKIAVISEEYPEIFTSCSKEFLESQAQHIKDVMVHAMNLRSETMTSTSRTKEWQKITEFRKRISPFYTNFLSSFVWIRKIFPDQMKEENGEIMKIDSIIDFFMNEINSSEGWRTCAAFRAISSFLKYFGQDISKDCFNSIFEACSKVYKQNPVQILPMMPDFLRYSALLTPKESTIWPTLTELAISSKCDSITFGNILQNYSEFDEDTLIKLVSFVIKELNEAMITEDEAIAIITILYHQKQDSIQAIVNCIFNTDIITKYENFYVLALMRASTNFKQANEDLCNESAIESISKFLLSIVFSNKIAIRVIAQTALLHEKTGSAILKNGIIDEVVMNFNKCPDAMTLLNFYQLILSKFDHSDDICEKIVHASLSLIIQYGLDRTIGLQTTSKAVEVIRLANSFLPNVSLQTYDKLDEPKKDEVLRILKKYAEKKTVKKLALKQFTVRPVRRGNNESNGEWQNLEDLED